MEVLGGASGQMTEIMPPFLRWLGQFAPDPIVDRENGADRVAIIADDRDDDIVHRVYANAVAVLGDTWNHRRLRVRGDNDTLASRAFWESLTEAHVLIYQRDTVILQQVPDDAFQWGLIGAPCGLRTLNGGFSLRMRNAMLDALDAYDYPSGGVPEDVFFCDALRALEWPLPDRETASRFAIEGPVDGDWVPVGVHGTDKGYLPLETARWIVDQAFAQAAA